MDKLLELFHMITDLPRILRRNKFEYISKENDVDNIWSFYFKPPSSFKIKAGEHLLLKLDHENQDDRGNIRFYSPASAPHEELIRITTRYYGEQSSSFKRSMFKMEKGDEINVMGPIGKFTLTDSDKEYIFIAGGVGITPFRSIILDLVKQDNLPHISLYYFNSSEDILFEDELDQLAEKHQNFNLHYLSRNDSVSEKKIRSVNSKNGLFYIAGAPNFVSAQKDRLKSYGVTVFRIKFDPFKVAKGG